MHSKGIQPVYLYANGEGCVEHGHISATELFGIDPLAENAFYNFEAGYPAFEKFYMGKREKIDLVMTDSSSNQALSGLEVKLTALPDNTTKKKDENLYGCEIVVRPPTICFLVCSLCSYFSDEKGRNELHGILSSVPQINHWEEMDSVLPHYGAIKEAVLSVSKAIGKSQRPLVLQPVWKTIGAKMQLADDCLDAFVWSDLALISLCMSYDKGTPTTISRPMRTIVWIYRMLFNYAIYGQFDYVRIIKLHSYAFANDKAFAMSGNATWPFLHCSELSHPRISKFEIQNIILGGGQDLLSPERRFDAVIAGSPDLFSKLNSNP